MRGTELAHRHLDGRHCYHGFGKGAPPRNPVSPQPTELEPFTDLQHGPFGDAHGATADERPTRVWSLTLSHSHPPPLTPTPAAEPDSSLSVIPPHAGALGTTWMGDAVDREGLSSPVPSPCALPLDSRDPYCRRGGTAAAWQAAAGRPGAQKGEKVPSDQPFLFLVLQTGRPWAQAAGGSHRQGDGVRDGTGQAALLWAAAFGSGLKGLVGGVAGPCQGGNTGRERICFKWPCWCWPLVTGQGPLALGACPLARQQLV